jgi:hypothetical protein
VSLKRELDTDWVPDPWTWSNPELLPDELEECGLRSFQVPLVTGTARSVPLLRGDWRVKLQAAVRRVMALRDGDLSDGVLGYRMLPDLSIEYYQEALKRWRIRNDALIASHRVVAMTDIASFFPNSRVDRIASVLADCPGSSELLVILAMLQDRFGHALPEGYAAARCLANLYLTRVDSAAAVPFTRWIDDYVLFCDGDEHADTILNNLEKAAGEFDLHLSTTKTRVVSSAIVSSVTHRGETQYQELLRAFPDLLGTNPQAANLLLYLAIKQADSTPLDSLTAVEPERLPEIIMPRLAWFLSANPWSESSTRLIAELFSVEDHWSEWRRTRLATALWYGSPKAAEACRSFLIEAVERQDAGAAIAGRVLAKHLSVDLDQRIDTFPGERERHLLFAELSASPNHGVAPPPIVSFL